MKTPAGHRAIGVVSDIHANALALDAALAELDAARVSHVVVLGDLLSYGVHVHETLARLERLARECATTFLVGNHDQLYFEMQRGERGYYEKMPAWIKESARATCAALDEARLRLADAFAWRDEHVDAGARILFSHANPFAPRDWTYLSSAESRARAARTLTERGMTAGVFGHTHRAHDDGRVWNPGSVGQPRDHAKLSSAAVVRVGADGDASFETFTLDYDEGAHCAAIRDAALSEETKREILKFHNSEREREASGR